MVRDLTLVSLVSSTSLLQKTQQKGGRVGASVWHSFWWSSMAWKDIVLQVRSWPSEIIRETLTLFVNFWGPDILPSSTQLLIGLYWQKAPNTARCIYLFLRPDYMSQVSITKSYPDFSGPIWPYNNSARSKKRDFHMPIFKPYSPKHQHTPLFPFSDKSRNWDKL